MNSKISIGIHCKEISNPSKTFDKASLEKWPCKVREKHIYNFTQTLFGATYVIVSVIKLLHFVSPQLNKTTECETGIFIDRGYKCIQVMADLLLGYAESEL